LAVVSAGENVQFAFSWHAVTVVAAWADVLLPGSTVRTVAHSPIASAHAPLFISVLPFLPRASNRCHVSDGH
jgi:hypothetical protein